MVSPYVELRSRSAFSFLDGASAPEDLVARAAELGYDAMALGDRDGVYGAPRFFRAARKTGVRPVVGAEVAIVGARPLLLLVETPAGYRNLCRLITAMKAGRPKNDPETAATHVQIEEHAAGLLALGGAVARVDLDRLKGIFGPTRLWMEVQRHHDDDQALQVRAAVAQADAMGVPVVTTNDVRYTEPRCRKVQDVLTCAREKTTVDEIGRRLFRNAERYLKPPAEMAALFADRKDAVTATREIAERCAFTLADLGYQFPVFPVPRGQTEQGMLEDLSWEGARQRYRHVPPCDRTACTHRVCKAKVAYQIRRELTIVGKLGLAGYFLVVWDIVRFAREQKILVQGRGSAANSAICYALGITAVDPVGMDLLFERFLSEERIRSAPNAADRIPDIDLDLPSGERREKVIQYTYARYGAGGGGGAANGTACGAAMTANVITYRPRMAVRTAGRALGFSEAQMTVMSKHLPWYVHPEDTPLSVHLADAGFPQTEERTRHLAEVATALLDLPRHLGQHSGGMVLCAGRLDDVVPLEPAAMPGRTVVQWDKDDCADLGIVKVDLLGLGMLAVLEDVVPMIRHHEGIEIDYACLPPDDPKVHGMLCKADTVGVFQVESRAQMATLPRMKPRRFYDLVVEVAIIRPGPIVGKMVNPYLRRRTGAEPVTYPHPCLAPILQRTLGVPLFQEQLIRMAMAAAGFTGGQAEELRRAMGFKRSVQKMAGIEDDLRAGMAKNGITGQAQEEIVTGIKSFALYGFPESHAASFALIAYASAYLKAHHPAAFLCGLLNNWPMGFYHPASLVVDGTRHGVETRPVDVTLSDWDCTLEGNDNKSSDNANANHDQDPLAVRLGLRYVAGLREDIGRRVMRERASRPFDAINDFHDRVRPHEDETRALAAVGAFARLGGSRRQALWQVEALGRSGPLFTRTTDDKSSPLPEMTHDEEVIADLRGTGVTTGPHPMVFARPAMQRRGVTTAADLLACRDGSRARIAGVVIVRQRPSTARGIVFVTLEDETGYSNAVVMPDVFARERGVIVSSKALLIEGVVQNREGVVTIRAERFTALDREVNAADRSHDFH